VQVRATARYARAIDATADLLGRLKIEVVYVGSVARAAWLGGEVARGSVDMIALMQSQQMDQLARIASNRGFRVEQEEIDQTVELDLVPLNFVDEEGDVRVHVLVATNALYGRMAAAAVEATLADSIIGARTLRVVTAEDLGLLTMMSEDDVTLRALTLLDAFDRRSFNQKLVSIGLAERVIAE
jgi:hypothetical protein